MLSEGLWALLTSTPTITDLIGTPETRPRKDSGVYPVKLPEAVVMANWPAIVIAQIAGGGDNVMEGPSGLRTARVQITAHGTDYLPTKQLAKAIRDLLDGIKTTLPDEDATEIDLGELVVEADTFQVAPFEYQTPLDFQFWFRES
jgi:hypothetical protein